MKHRGNIGLIGILTALCILGCHSGSDTKRNAAGEKAVLVKAMQVRAMTSSDGRWWPGRAEATREVNLSFRVAGPLITRPVNVGDKIEKGDILARIDPRDFEVNLRSAEGRLAKARAMFKRAERDYNRVVRIRKEDPGATSAMMLDKNREALDLAKAEIISLEADVDAARDRLGYTYLKAPFGGCVAAVYIENHEYVQARQNIVRLLDLSKIEMTIDIPEALISRARQTEEIHVCFDAFAPYDISAHIKEIGVEASQVTRTYPVTLIMNQPKDIKILPGMAGKALWRVGLQQDGAESGVAVPMSAVFSCDGNDGSAVWVIDSRSGRVSRRKVVADELGDAAIIVRKGLTAGEWIVTAGIHYLEEGQKVRFPKTEVAS